MNTFHSADIKTIFRNKFVVVIGDSIQRGIYKDIVLLLQEDRYLYERELRGKGEYSFLNDELIEGGRKGEMTNGVKYSEVRQYSTDTHLIRFYFVTRCYNSYVESILTDLKEEPAPDIVMMNSCLWDITRYGGESIVTYKDNLVNLCNRFKEVLPNDCLFLWNTTLPISNQARGGFLIPQIEFMTTTLRLDILEANYYAQSVFTDHGFDVVDLHFYLRHHLDKRVRDGIHWDMLAHRYMTNLLLAHISKAFAISLPNRGFVPFSRYEDYYNSDNLDDFTNVNVESGEIQQMWHDSNRNTLQNFYSTLKNTVSNTLRTFNGCLPGFQQTNDDVEHNRHGWHQSWNRHNAGNMPRQNRTIIENPYDRPVNPPVFHRYNGPSENEKFRSPIFHTPNYNYDSGHSSRDFTKDYFEPYQQNEYQGASYGRRRNRHQPYRPLYDLPVSMCFLINQNQTNYSPGYVKEFAIKLHVEKGAVPKFCQDRIPSYALHQGIEVELSR